MVQRFDLNRAAREIFTGGLHAVDATVATRRALKLDESRVQIFADTFDLTARPAYVVALGKAAASMAGGLSEVLGNKIAGGVITTRGPLSEDLFPADRWQSFLSGHPLPNQQSLDAAQAAFNLLDQAEVERALLIFLVSGGGSSMIESPLDEITIEELRETNRLLVSCGASIADVNCVRRAISAVKGGKLALRAPHTDQVTLIVSDVNPGDEASVASGPSLPPPIDSRAPLEIVKEFGLDSSLPSRVLKAIARGPQIEFRNFSICDYHVLLNNQTAVAAAAEKARQLGFAVAIADDIREQPIDEGCHLLIARLEQLQNQHAAAGQPTCLISGGEFSCPVKGNGIGGRNLETVLRCAMILDQKRRGSVAILSAGTDGIDGNSPAAGAMADESTISRALARGLDPSVFLEASDAFTFFEELGDVLITGPTNTNVRDLRVLLSQNPSP